tara:strand:+ start:336 stop:887 length:552 start_codon:yes stop_codon:yes gene_type:complete
MTDWNKNAMDYGQDELLSKLNQLHAENKRMDEISRHNDKLQAENDRLQKQLETRLFKWEEFTSHAGKRLPFKIECDAFDEKDWDTIASMIMLFQERPFWRAEGIPRGGLPLAKALNKYASGNKDDMPLICDDVWTTGKSFKDYLNEHHPNHLAGWGHRWVVFQRGPNQNLNSCRCLFRLCRTD